MTPFYADPRLSPAQSEYARLVAGPDKRLSECLLVVGYQAILMLGACVVIVHAIRPSDILIPPYIYNLGLATFVVRCLLEVFVVTYHLVLILGFSITNSEADPPDAHRMHDVLKKTLPYYARNPYRSIVRIVATTTFAVSIAALMMDGRFAFGGVLIVLRVVNWMLGLAYREAQIIAITHLSDGQISTLLDKTWWRPR